MICLFRNKLTLGAPKQVTGTTIKSSVLPKLKGRSLSGRMMEKEEWYDNWQSRGEEKKKKKKKKVKSVRNWKRV